MWIPKDTALIRGNTVSIYIENPHQNENKANKTEIELWNQT